MKTAHILASNVPVAGVLHLGQKDLKNMTLKNEIILEPEPENIYDKNAIKVIVKDCHIGYVPKGLAAEIKMHKKLTAVIKWIGEKYGNWGMRIDIFSVVDEYKTAEEKFIDIFFQGYSGRQLLTLDLSALAEEKEGFEVGELLGMKIDVFCEAEDIPAAERFCA